MQFIEFTCSNDRFLQATIDNKIQKYQPLINNIMAQGWKVDPLIVITTGARGTTHNLSMKLIETKLKLPEIALKYIFKAINTIAIQYARSIILHERKIENNQLLSTPNRIK